jgi:DNA topoisomerase VI subunit B
MAAVATLERTAFRTSRLLEFCSRKELIAQTGHEPDVWPMVVLKELVDNALDACEEAGIAPEIGVQVGPDAITVIDNGPGMPSATVTDILDFSNRVSSREAYVAPDRGAQGNALKTILAMPFVLDGAAGHVEIRAHGLCHHIAFTVDALRQAPVIDHRCERCDVRNGTSIKVVWPESAGPNPDRGRAAILTNRRRLHLAQPASRPRRDLVRRALHGARNRSHMAEVAAVRSYLPTLVHAPAPRAPDRRLSGP